MSSSPRASDSDSDDENRGDTSASESAASDPESARREAEEALARVESLAGIDDVESPESDTETSSEPPNDSSSGDHCANCGAALHGPYCSECGQKAEDRIMPIWRLLNEALDAIYALDLRVLRTLPRFLFYPGRVTKDYINGRRRRYIRPFRLYLFSTFVLFAVMAVTTTGLLPSPTKLGNHSRTSTADSTARADSSSFVMFGSPAKREKIAEEIRSDSSFVDVTLYADPAANERLEALLQEKSAQVNENPREFVDGLLERGPYVMFVMLPIFALLLKLLYIRGGYLYVEHLIFSLHVHALTFIAFTVAILLQKTGISWVSNTAPWISASPVLYLLLAMKHVYEQGIIASTVKASILLLIYLVVLAIGLAGLVLAGILLI